MPFARNFTTEISFDSTDKDQNNVISKEEFRHFLLADAKNKAARSRNTTPNPVSGTKSVSQTSFDSADIDRNGNVSKEEFRAFLIGNAAENSALKQESSPQFNVADENKDGTVSKEEFQKYLLVSASSVTETAGMTCGEAGHADCPLQDMPEEVCCMSGFEWKNGNEKFAYKGPSKMIASADGKTIFIANRDAAEVVVLDTVQNKIVQTLPVGKEPNSLVLSSDEKIIYVTSGGYNGRLQAVDLDSGNIINETVTGHTPQGLVLLPDGKRIFVCNRFNASVTEYHLPEMTPVRHIKTIREPCGA
ncbi:MAG: EF-hand domain-containing protein, partial [Planctomycetaceae bacterium]|nr:EF-hand domain-containing protein [Planctomycetaceae bacterium]